MSAGGRWRKWRCGTVDTGAWAGGEFLWVAICLIGYCESTNLPDGGRGRDVLRAADIGVCAGPWPGH